jgi:hypothetical protein
MGAAREGEPAIAQERQALHRTGFPQVAGDRQRGLPKKF